MSTYGAAAAAVGVCVLACGHAYMYACESQVDLGIFPIAFLFDMVSL